MRFSKMYIFGAPIESEGPGMVSSRAPRGLDNVMKYIFSKLTAVLNSIKTSVEGRNFQTDLA